MWVMLVIFTVHGNGVGAIHAERFGAYDLRLDCERAATAIKEPAFLAGSHAGSRQVYCVEVPETMTEDSQ